MPLRAYRGVSGPPAPLVACLVVACLLIAACSSGKGPSATPSATPTATRTTPLPRFGRVVIVMMENKEYGSIIGSSKAPYINSLADAHALARNFYGIRHPSLPNYLALLGGSTFGISENCTDCHVAEPSLVDQMEDARISWKAYAEGMPGRCFPGGSHGLYAKKHNPFMYFDGITSDPKRCAKVAPLTDLAVDIKNKRLPKFMWIIPDGCHQMHDCSIKEGDDYLAGFLPGIIEQLGPGGVLFLTFDEGTTNEGCCEKAAGGHIATIVVGPAAREKANSKTPYSLYSILRTIEESWDLPLLGDAACACTASMTDLIRPAGS